MLILGRRGRLQVFESGHLMGLCGLIFGHLWLESGFTVYYSPPFFSPWNLYIYHTSFWRSLVVNFYSESIGFSHFRSFIIILHSGMSHELVEKSELMSLSRRRSQSRVMHVNQTQVPSSPLGSWDIPGGVDSRPAAGCLSNPADSRSLTREIEHVSTSCLSTIS